MAVQCDPISFPFKRFSSAIHNERHDKTVTRIHNLPQLMTGSAASQEVESQGGKLILYAEEDVERGRKTATTRSRGRGRGGRVRRGEDVRLVEGAVDGDGDAEAPDGEGVHEGSVKIVSIGFMKTEGMRMKNKKRYGKDVNGRKGELRREGLCVDVRRWRVEGGVLLRIESAQWPSTKSKDKRMKLAQTSTLPPPRSGQATSPHSSGRGLARQRHAAHPKRRREPREEGREGGVKGIDYEVGDARDGPKCSMCTQAARKARSRRRDTAPWWWKCEGAAAATTLPLAPPTTQRKKTQILLKARSSWGASVYPLSPHDSSGAKPDEQHKARTTSAKRRTRPMLAPSQTLQMTTRATESGEGDAGGRGGGAGGRSRAGHARG
ncbi:hypothetical protein B0H16DRAFT_1469614 [Mycena metata]|uniref:Uncharacterized protein n=1 Tax=Mycena metata TaxID=1033252 RepID=A0AAD7HXK0_9AGAR|nr:hypothetical protein B0H16DRAFT_1469614 [Mycena metata]